MRIELGRAPTRGLARVQRWRLPSPSGGYGWTREATTISPRWGRGGVACGCYSVWDSGHRCNVFSAICVLKGAVADATVSSLTGWGPGGSCLSSLYRSRFTEQNSLARRFHIYWEPAVPPAASTRAWGLRLCATARAKASWPRRIADSGQISCCSGVLQKLP